MLILSVCVLKISFVLMFLWRTTDNNLGAEGAAALAPALGRMPNLTELDLFSKCGVCIWGWGVGACVVLVAWVHVDIVCVCIENIFCFNVFVADNRHPSWRWGRCCPRPGTGANDEPHEIEP